MMQIVIEKINEKIVSTLLENVRYYNGTDQKEVFFLLNLASNWLFSQVFGRFLRLNFMKTIQNAI